MEKKLAYNVVFSNHINNEKSAQQVGLGSPFFWGAIETAKKLHDTLDPPAAHFFCY